MYVFSFCRLHKTMCRCQVLALHLEMVGRYLSQSPCGKLNIYVLGFVLSLSSLVRSTGMFVKRGSTSKLIRMSSFALAQLSVQSPSQAASRSCVLLEYPGYVFY